MIILPELSRKCAQILSTVDEAHALSSSKLAGKLRCNTSDALLAAMTVVHWGQAARYLKPTSSSGEGVEYFFYGVSSGN